MQVAPLLCSAGGVHFGTTGHDSEEVLVSRVADHERNGSKTRALRPLHFCSAV